MKDDTLNTTWDGKPVSPEPPHGASIVVYRRKDEDYEFLILHRAHNGSDYEGLWAWTPPAGARYPDETVEQCAKRELKEETGLRLSLQATELGDGSWAIFFAEENQGEQLTLDEEHDQFLWVSFDEATKRCTPQWVSDAIVGVGHRLGIGHGHTPK